MTITPRFMPLEELLIFPQGIFWVALSGFQAVKDDPHEQVWAHESAAILAIEVLTGLPCNDLLSIQTLIDQFANMIAY